MRVIVTHLARDDIRRGHAFYLKGGRDVAARFTETVLSRLAELKSTAGIHVKIFGHYRMLVSPFPFVVYYDIHEDTVIVRAVLDCRQSPRLHRKRAKDKFF